MCIGCRLNYQSVIEWRLDLSVKNLLENLFFIKKLDYS